MSECPKCDVDGDALVAVIDRNCEKIAKLEARNKELLEALQKIRNAYRSNGNTKLQQQAFAAIDAAIAKAQP